MSHSSSRAASMKPRITPAILAAIVLGAGGCGIPLDGYAPLTCAAEGSFPALLAGFNLAEPADYVALRSGDAGAYVIEDSVGTPCATATDVAACEAALEGPSPDDALRLGECVQICSRYTLIVNRGDDVQFITDPAGLVTLLGTVDTPEEAVAVAMSEGYGVDCGDEVGDGGVRAADDGFEVIATQYTSTCSPIVENRLQLGVAPDAVVTELQVQEIKRDLMTCIGRRPEGLVPAPAPVPSVGAWLADVARLEAAAVHAFSDLAAALAAHGAPPELLAQVAEARRDEVRHTRQMAGLARRFGGVPRAPEVRPTAVPTLEALALENAVEGCVRETFGALVGLWQAGAAQDAEVRATMAAVGVDEARHAALSWAIAAWAEPQLDPAARARVAAAREAALASLIADAALPVDDALVHVAGLPTPAQQQRLLAGLTAQLAA